MIIFFYDYQSYEALFNGCCKDNASREQRCKLACKLCRGAAYLMQRYKMKNKERFPHVGNGNPEFYIILNY